MFKNKDSLNCLHVAAHSGQAEVVHLLATKYKCPVDSRTRNNDTPLHLAALGGHNDVVMILINEFHCNPEERGCDNQTLLHSACIGGNIELVNTLLSQSKCDPYLVDENVTILFILLLYMVRRRSLDYLLQITAPSRAKEVRAMTLHFI